MFRTLVTGGGGQLGKALRGLLSDAEAPERARLDVSDRQAVMHAVAQIRPQVIINAAAFTKVDEAEADPEAAHRVNVLGAGNLAEAAQSVGALLVQVSTDYVFSGDKEGPYSETDPTFPMSVYGKTKLEGEKAAALCPESLIVRTSWVFGEGHNFIRSILKAAAGGSAELSVVADQQGRPTYAPHLANGLLTLVEAGARGVFHLTGSGPATTWAELAEYALTAAGLRTIVKRITTADYAATRKGPFAPRPQNSVLDCSRAAALGVVLPPWTEAVSDYLSQAG